MLLGKIPLHTGRPSNRCSFGSCPQSLASVSCPRIHLRRGVKDKFPFKEVLFTGQSICCYRLKPVSSLSSEDAHPISQVFMSKFNSMISYSRFIVLLHVNKLKLWNPPYFSSLRVEAFCSRYHCWLINKIKWRNQCNWKEAIILWNGIQWQQSLLELQIYHFCYCNCLRSYSILGIFWQGTNLHFWLFLGWYWVLCGLVIALRFGLVKTDPKWCILIPLIL